MAAPMKRNPLFAIPIRKRMIGHFMVFLLSPLIVALSSTRVWGQEALHVLKHDTAATSMSLSSDGRVLAVGYGQAEKPGQIIIWDTNSANPIRRLNGHEFAVAGITFNDSNEYIIAAGLYNSLRVWNAKTGKMTFSIEDLKYITALERISGRKTIVTCENGSLYLWNISNPTVLSRVKGQPDLGECSQFTVSANGRFMATAKNEGLSESVPKSPPSIIIWDLLRYKIIGSYPGKEKNNVTCMRLSSDGTSLAIGYFFGRNNLEVLDTKTGRVIFNGSGHLLPPRAIAFSSDDKHLATGDYGGRMIAWDIATKPTKRVVNNAHKNSIEAITFSPDNQRVFSASYDGTVKIWRYADLR